MRLRFDLCGCPLWLALAACTATEVRPSAPPDPPVPPTPPSVIVTAEPPAPAQPPWTERYRRRCLGSTTPPVLSLDQRSMVLCDARFSLAEGRYEGEAPLGVLALLGDIAITDDYGDGGLSVRTTSREATLLHHATGGRPELLSVSVDGTIVASVERTAHGLTLRTLRLPTLEAVAAVELPDAGHPVALVATAEGGALAYGERGCRVDRTPCLGDSKATCDRRICEPSRGWRMSPEGTLRSWDAVPPGLVAVAFDRSAAWVMAVDAEGRRWLQRVDQPSERLELPGRATIEHPTPALALAPEATTVAVGDAEHLELWRRDGSTVERVATLPYGGLESLALTDDAQTLLLGWGDGLHVVRPGLAPERSPSPSYDRPPLAGWTRASMVDGRLGWPDGHGTLAPGEDGIVAWYREEMGADFRVVLDDRAEIGRPELSVDTWTALVLDRIDPWTYFDGGIEVPHTLQRWTTPEGRAFELHYTTVGGCEKYEVVRRVQEHGDWLVRYELRTFAGMPWRDAWAGFVHEPLGAPPVATP